MTDLKEIICNHIHLNGPMDIGTYMNFALGHPEYGYYMTRDPLGKEGDFTTAPEVSQMFGELIGAWLADMWMQSKVDSSFLLTEFGPGRGTLMADIMRIAKQIPAFEAASSIHMVETSPVLRQKQKQSLSGYECNWHDDLSTLPTGVPLFFIANEFLDALPVRQYQKANDNWHERLIGIDDNGALDFGLSGTLAVDNIPEFVAGKPNGSIYEAAPAREQFLNTLMLRIKEQGGCGLFIDYGYTMDRDGDTLQAIQNHQKCDFLHEPGQADLTAHVDFSMIERCAADARINHAGAAFQGAFLLQLGLQQRAQMLKAQASEQQAKDIDTALHRLTAETQMGTLFKVSAIWSFPDIVPAGF